VVLGIHPYRVNRTPWPWPQWPERLDRPYAVSEIGWHTQRWKRGWFRRGQWDNGQVAEFLTQEYGHWDLALGARLMVWFQLNDDAGVRADRFGLYGAEVSDVTQPILKPQGLAFRELSRC